MQLWRHHKAFKWGWVIYICCSFFVLRFIKSKTWNNSSSIFKGNKTKSSRIRRNIYWKYEIETIFIESSHQLHPCRVLLLKDSNIRFCGMTTAVMWTTLLGPQFSPKSTKWKSKQENSTSKNSWIQRKCDCTQEKWQSRIAYRIWRWNFKHWLEIS